MWSIHGWAQDSWLMARAALEVELPAFQVPWPPWRRPLKGLLRRLGFCEAEGIEDLPPPPFYPQAKARSRTPSTASSCGLSRAMRRAVQAQGTPSTASRSSLVSAARREARRAAMEALAKLALRAPWRVSHSGGS